MFMEQSPDLQSEWAIPVSMTDSPGRKTAKGHHGQLRRRYNHDRVYLDQ